MTRGSKLKRVPMGSTSFYLVRTKNLLANRNPADANTSRVRGSIPCLAQWTPALPRLQTPILLSVGHPC